MGVGTHYQEGKKKDCTECHGRIVVTGSQTPCEAWRLCDALAGKKFADGVFLGQRFLSGLCCFLQQALENGVGILIYLPKKGKT